MERSDSGRGSDAPAALKFPIETPKLMAVRDLLLTWQVNAEAHVSWISQTRSQEGLLFAEQERDGIMEMLKLIEADLDGR